LYNAFGSRAHSFYGNAEAEKEKRPIHKHYSADGSVEIKEDKAKGSINFVFYLGGDPYTAPAVYSSNGEEGKLLFLHRDQLGSIIAITDLNGKLVEARHFDAWGKVLSITDANGNKLTSLLLDRGYTGHEHLASVGFIHCNGRLYDPALHRFLMPDNYIQDPFNTQNFNRYGYCLNNPLVYVDQDGEWIFLVAAVIGAYIGGAQANGTYNPFKWNYSNANTWIGMAGGAVIGGVSAGVGSAVGGTIAGGTTLVSSMVGGAVGGAISGGGFAVLPGGNGKVLQGMGIGALSGAVGGLIGGAIGKASTVMLNNYNVTNPLLRSTITGIASGAAGGYAGGFVGGLVLTGDASIAAQNGFSGFASGAAVGAISGIIGNRIVTKKNRVLSRELSKALEFNSDYDFSPDPMGDNVTLYRGTTGSEGKGDPLFMTDNVEYARSYIKNGGSLVKVTISRFTLKQMIEGGNIIKYNGEHGTMKGYEYQIQPKYVPTFIKLFNK